MNLQRNHPRQRDLRIWLGVVHRQRPVDIKSDAPAFTMDLVAIPITGGLYDRGRNEGGYFVGLL